MLCYGRWHVVLWYVQVLFVHAATDADHARRLAANAGCLKVRGRVVQEWALHLREQYKEVFPNAEFSNAAYTAYEEVDGVPGNLLDSAVFAHGAEEAATLQQLFTTPRQGHNDVATHFPTSTPAPTVPVPHNQGDLVTTLRR